MGPLWSGQGTVPHCTVSDLLSTDVLVSPSGALVGAAAGRRHAWNYFKCIYYHYLCCGDVDSRRRLCYSFQYQSYTATTLIVQLLPGAREEKVWVVALETSNWSISRCRCMSCTIVDMLSAPLSCSVMRQRIVMGPLWSGRVPHAQSVVCIHDGKETYMISGANTCAVVLTVEETVCYSFQH